MDRKQALDDFGYEWRMFRSLHGMVLVLPRIDDPVRDALVESVVLHTRNLIETFWGTKEGRKLRDVLGITHVKMPAVVGRFYEAASRSVVHLRPNRPLAKTDWDYADVGPALRSKIQQLRDDGVIPASGWEGDRDVQTRMLSEPFAAQLSGKIGVLGPDYYPNQPIGPTGPAGPPNGDPAR